MADSRPDEYLEIYKLHADLADRVSQRREGANRLYVSLVAGLGVFIAALLRFDADGGPDWVVVAIVGAFGALLSLSWFLVLRSYRQLNSEKFRVLHELEDQLVYQFFKREWDPTSVGRKSNRYRRLTQVEVTLPAIFGTLFVAVAIYSLFQ